jgi:hypothetical protein
MFNFINELKVLNIDPEYYIDAVKENAKKYGINPDFIYFSDKPKYKLYYTDNGKKIYFGSATHPDYLIYKWIENYNDIENLAENKRDRYLKRSTNIKGDWEKNKLSKNNLSINLLWQ